MLADLEALAPIPRPAVGEIDQPAGVSVTTPLVLVSEFHTCDTSPVSPRDELARTTIPPIGTSDSAAISATPMRRRTRGLSCTRSIATAAAYPARGQQHHDHEHDHAERVAGGGARGEHGVVMVSA